MRRRTKIIQINGIKGLIMALFVVICLAAGFVLFPGLVAMSIWNKVFSNVLPSINMYQGVLLWIIIVLTGFVFSKRKVSVSFGMPKGLTDDEMNAVMQRIKLHSNEKMSVDTIDEKREDEGSENNSVLK